MASTDGEIGTYRRLAVRLAKPEFAFDYANQAWIRWGVYIRCGHGEYCVVCFGRLHEGEEPAPNARIQYSLDMYLEGG